VDQDPPRMPTRPGGCNFRRRFHARPGARATDRQVPSPSLKNPLLLRDPRTAPVLSYGWGAGHVVPSHEPPRRRVASGRARHLSRGSAYVRRADAYVPPTPALLFSERNERDVPRARERGKGSEPFPRVLLQN